MKYFVIGALTPFAVYCLAWFAAKGWRHGYGKQVTDVYIHNDKPEDIPNA